MPSGDPIRTSDAYDAWHQVAHGAEAAGDLHLSQWHHDAMRLAPALDGLDVLEVGCGAGDFAIHVAKAGAAVTAVDFSPAAIEMARAKAKAHGMAVQFQSADAEALPFADGSFDVVLSCECLEHVPDPLRALVQMARVLRPSGHLVLTTENYSNALVLAWMNAWRRGVPFNSGTHVQPIEHFFLFWRVRQYMRDAGLRVIRMTGAHHVFLLLPGFHAHAFVRERFHSRALAWLFRPLARQCRTSPGSRAARRSAGESSR